MSILSGVVVTEAIELKSTLDSVNPIIGQDQMQLSYDSIASGVYQGVRARVGPGNWNDLTDVFNNSGSNKLLKSVTMTVDYQYVYTVSAGDIAALGSNIIVSQVIVNNEMFPASVIYSDYPLSASDTITLTGLPAMASVSSLRFILQ